MAKNHFTFEKRRKELEKKKKKEAKRLARLEKKAQGAEDEAVDETTDKVPPVAVLDAAGEEAGPPAELETSD